MSVRLFLTFPSRESERKATIFWVPRFDARSKWALAPWSSFVTERGYTWHRRALRCSRMERLHRCGGQRFAFEGKPPGNHWFGKFYWWTTCFRSKPLRFMASLAKLSSIRLAMCVFVYNGWAYTNFNFAVQAISIYVCMYIYIYICICRLQGVECRRP